MRHYKKEMFEENGKEKETLLEEFEQDVWDIKKITVGIVLLVFFIGGGIYAAKYFHILPDFSYIFSTKVPSQAVAGVSTKQGEKANQASSSSSLQNLNPQQKLEELKQQVNNLHVQDVVQNSPQVQKLQKDLQNLTKIPGDAAKQECLQICNGL